MNANVSNTLLSIWLQVTNVQWRKAKVTDGSAHGELSPISLELIHSFSTAVLSMQLKRENRDPSLVPFLPN